MLQGLIKSVMYAVLCILIGSGQSFGQVGCPAVNAGPDQNVGCSNPCANLSAGYFYAGQTTTYTAIPIPYIPNPYNVGTPILVNIDDTWSNVINLPFNFCFYGVNYSQVVIGSNGIITFNTTVAGALCPWSFAGTAPLPSATVPVNSIMGIYQDIDPTNQGTIYYQLAGTAPCRKLIVSYYNIPYFGDPNSVSTGACSQALFATSQIVLYETTNAIDIYVESKPTCTGWNSGLAYQGIQNANGTQATTIPGRNRAVFNLTNDAFRFLPSGPSIVNFSWLQNGAPYSTNISIQVCPTVTTTYTAQAIYTTCNGTQIIVTDDVVITPSGVVQSNVSQVQPVSCNNGNNGSLSASASAGQAPYAYSWSNGATAATISGLSPGLYTVTVTDANGCSSSDTISLANPPPLVLSTPVVQNILCNGLSTGSITTTVSGGSAPLTYTWSGGSSSGSSLTNIPAGAYTLTVTDNNGCTTSTSANVTQPATLVANFSGTNVTCNAAGNGSATASVSGGVAPYTYTWNTNPVQTTSAVAGLAGGTYTCLVTDANGCTRSGNVAVVEPAAINLNLTVNQPACGSNGLGSANVTANGGVAPLTYSWQPSGGTSTSANNLNAGNYSITVTDANGCTSRDTFHINLIVPISISLIADSVSCNGISDGSVQAIVTGGVAPLQYAWNPGGSSQLQLSNLAAGSYTLLVTDANSCTSTSSITVFQPLPLNLSLTVTQPVCGSNGLGSASATASGGTAPLSYNWQPNGGSGLSANNLPAGNYSFAVTDGNGCSTRDTFHVDLFIAMTLQLTSDSASCFGFFDGNVSSNVTGGVPPLSFSWSPGGSTTQQLNGVASGIYTLLITDANNCTVSATGTVFEPAPVVAQANANPAAICEDDPVSLSASGGVSYVWSTGQIGPVISTNPIQSTVYTVTVTEANGCTDQDSVSVTVHPLPVVDFSGSSVCFQQPTLFQNNTSIPSGSIAVYNWDFGDGQSSSIPVTGYTYTSPGTYSVVLEAISDQGCVSSDSETVSVWVLPTAALVPDVVEGCPPLNVRFNETVQPGGASIQTYQWEFGNGATSLQSDPSTTYPISGYFSVALTVTDANGCSDDTAMTNLIHVFDQPVADFVTSPENPSEYIPEVLFLDRSQFAAQWFWSFGDSTVSFTQNPFHVFPGPGEYWITLAVTGPDGCTDTISRKLEFNPETSLWVPSAFSPNGDNKNEVFQVQGQFFNDFRMEIFDRWGQLVFSTNDPLSGWDGTYENAPAIEDVYVVKIVYRDTVNKERVAVVRVTLLR